MPLSNDMKEILAQKYHHKSLREVLLDKKFAGLGDAYVNFIYSLAYSVKFKELSGIKVRSETLTEALKRAGLRNLLPGRLNRHVLGNAAEALILHAWLNNLVSDEECVNILKDHLESPVEAFTSLLLEIRKRWSV